MNDDKTLADTADSDTPVAASSPFGNPDAPTPPTGRRQWTLEDILTKAKRPEKYATICLRADLQAEHDRIVTDLSTLVTPAGELIDPDADETSLGQESPLAAVERLNRELADVRAEMQDSMWFPRFRGMSSDDLVVFQEQHYPKKEGVNLVGWQNQLVAASMIEPTVTVADVEKLRGTLGAQAMRKLIDTATEVNLRGGIDIPFSPSFSRPPTQR